MFFSAEEFLNTTKKDLHNSSDVGSRTLKCNDKTVAMIFLKSMINQELFSDAIYKPVKNSNCDVSNKTIEKVILCDNVEDAEFSQAVEKILKGYVIIFIEGEKNLISVDIAKFPMRSPSEPPTSPVIRGPRIGFTEDLKTNLTLIRRRFYSEKLVLKDMKIGRYSQTQICIAYLDGIADKKVVKEIQHKLKKVDIDGVVDAFYVGKFLEDRPNSLFKQIGNAEKPDIVAGKMLEGRVAILVDGSPIVLTLPFILIEDFQSSNDYYTSNHYATLIRYVRIVGFLLAVIASGMYISLRLFHFNVIPTKFLITITDTTQAIPFTPFVELLFITLLFQVLYEVSLRLPSYLGLATSIVGALILGDTGVNAGLISPPGVIVIALAKIAVYTIPEQAPQLTVLQIVFLILGGSLGLLGIVGGMFYLINYLNRIDSYGAPYLAPYSPRINSDLKDGFTKKSLVDMKKRPMSFSNKNITRLK